MRKAAKSAAVMAGATALFATMGTGTANAATDYYLGNNTTEAGYSFGSIDIFMRSSLITGTVKSNTTGCAQVTFRAPEKPLLEETRTACGRGTGTSKGFEFTLPTNVDGGASRINIELWTLDSKGDRYHLIDYGIVVR
ncbi:hypothetical protein ACIHCQ_09730 [Streptomyces sp. NPDC052236]|uniref:hypothetical protein n=1 Tax=Streptomyces sp. NPDC052236 TaxID=3365686 RepID=UPI0037CE3049